MFWVFLARFPRGLTLMWHKRLHNSSLSEFSSRLGANHGLSHPAVALVLTAQSVYLPCGSQDYFVERKRLG